MSNADTFDAEFELLYRRSIDRVYAYARARVGPVEAEDVVSEVFVAAASAIRAGNAAAVTEAWLIAVARNKVADRWRFAYRQMAKIQRIIDWTPRRGAEHESIGGYDHLIDALDRISLRHRSLLILHYLDGYPMAEVAQQLGMTTEGARSGIARARRSFKTAYEGVASDG